MRPRQTREDLKMWFLHPDRAVRRLTVLKHEEVPEERLRTVNVCLFSIGGPEIEGAAYRLFCPIIEIVAKGRADLGFGLDNSDQCSPANNQEIPLFGGSEEAWQFNCLLPENAVPRDSNLRNKVREKRNKPVHLCTAGDCTAETLIGLPPASCFFRWAALVCQ